MVSDVFVGFRCYWVIKPLTWSQAQVMLRSAMDLNVRFYAGSICKQDSHWVMPIIARTIRKDCVILYTNILGCEIELSEWKRGLFFETDPAKFVPYLVVGTGGLVDASLEYGERNSQMLI